MRLYEMAVHPTMEYTEQRSLRWVGGVQEEFGRYDDLRRAGREKSRDTLSDRLGGQYQTVLAIGHKQRVEYITDQFLEEVFKPYA
jgi:hypothetical protein